MSLATLLKLLQIVIIQQTQQCNLRDKNIHKCESQSKYHDYFGHKQISGNEEIKRAFFRY